MELTKADGWPWFERAVESLDLGSSTTKRAWGAAWSAYEAAESPQAERWKGWVRQMVQRALSQARTNPGGLFLTLLADPPDFAGAAPSLHRAGQPHAPDEYFHDQKASIEPGPPMAWVFQADRSLGHPRGWQLVHDEWVRQGRPFPHEFDSSPLTQHIR